EKAVGGKPAQAFRLSDSPSRRRTPPYRARVARFYRTKTDSSQDGPRIVDSPIENGLTKGSKALRIHCLGRSGYTGDSHAFANSTSAYARRSRVGCCNRMADRRIFEAVQYQGRPSDAEGSRSPPTKRRDCAFSRIAGSAQQHSSPFGGQQ